MIQNKPLASTQKFDVFRQNLISDNEEKFGQEIREKYGNHNIDQANQNISSMTQATYQEETNRESHILFILS